MARVTKSKSSLFTYKLKCWNHTFKQKKHVNLKESLPAWTYAWARCSNKKEEIYKKNLTIVNTRNIKNFTFWSK